MSKQDKINAIAGQLRAIEETLVELGAYADTREKRRALVKAHRLTRDYHDAMKALADEHGGVTIQGGGDK